MPKMVFNWKAQQAYYTLTFRDKLPTYLLAALPFVGAFALWYFIGRHQ